MAESRYKPITQAEIRIIRNESRKALCEAIVILGSATKLARALGIFPEIINGWLNISQFGVADRYVIAIEKATKAKITRERLRSDLYYK